MVRNLIIDVAHGLAGTLHGQKELQKDAEKVIKHVERSLKKSVR
jgi:hypothetical protein